MKYRNEKYETIIGEIPDWGTFGGAVHLLAVAPPGQPYLVDQRGKGCDDDHKSEKRSNGAFLYFHRASLIMLIMLILNGNHWMKYMHFIY